MAFTTTFPWTGRSSSFSFLRWHRLTHRHQIEAGDAPGTVHLPVNSYDSARTSAVPYCDGECGHRGRLRLLYVKLCSRALSYANLLH